MDDGESPLKIEDKTTTEGVRVVALEGRFDASAMEDVDAYLRSLLDEEKVARMVLDLGGVVYMGSSAVRLLLALSARLKERGGRLVLARLPESGLRVMRIMQIDRLFEIHPDVGPAVESLARTS